MSIRSVIGAAVVAVGMGSAADAATYTRASYDLTVRYDGTSFSGVHYSNIDPEIPDQHFSEVAPDDRSLGLKSHLFGLPEFGTVFQFVVDIVHPDVPGLSDPYYGNGGRTPVCQLGPWDCTETNKTSIDPLGFYLQWDDDWYMNVPAQAGSSFFVYYSATYGSNGPGTQFTDNGNGYSYESEDSYFTVIAVNSPAPVPLPATAALLPLGIGALALMRRRRRSA